MTQTASPEAPSVLAGPEGRELARELYRQMLRIRLFEEGAIRVFRDGSMPAMVHLSIGQEAAIAGACVATRTSDYMTGNHRSHGHPIAKGADLRGLFAELLGKATGVCKGKGGSMHLADFSVGSLGESGIVGAAIPVAVGAGLAAQMEGAGRVALCFFGDGAANEGVCHEAMNLASVWKLPVIFLCENNDWAVSVRAGDLTAVRDIAQRAAGYDMPGTVVDGQYVVACYEAVDAAVRRARAGEGPSLVEAKTYRFHEHAYGLKVPHPYRDEEEVRGWTEGRDPVPLFQQQLSTWGVLGDDELAQLREEVAATVEDAIEFALASPDPDPATAYHDLYAPAYDPATDGGRR